MAGSVTSGATILVPCMMMFSALTKTEVVAALETLTASLPVPCVSRILLVPLLCLRCPETKLVQRYLARLVRLQRGNSRPCKRSNDVHNRGVSAWCPREAAPRGCWRSLLSADAWYCESAMLTATSPSWFSNSSFADVGRVAKPFRRAVVMQILGFGRRVGKLIRRPARGRLLPIVLAVADSRNQRTHSRSRMSREACRPPEACELLRPAPLQAPA